MVPFALNPNQWILKEQLKAHQRRIGGKIRFISVKARRVGVSSWTEGLGVAHIASMPNAAALIVACLAETAADLFRVPTDLVKGWPFPLPEPLTKNLVYPHREGDSHMKIATAKSVIAGRGGTLSFLHLSEAAYYPGAASFMSLLPSVSDDPSTIIGIESTAAGKTGIGEQFWLMWEAAVKGENEYLPVFLTWLDDPYCRRDASDISFADTDITEDERDLIALTACKPKCSRCDACHKALQCIAWRRWAIVNLCQGRIDDFRREYPITAEEAFYANTVPAFQRDELRWARECIAEPISTGRLSQDSDKYGNANKGKIVFTPDDRSTLLIWSWPKRDHHYYVGVDSARGIIGKDYAAAAVWCGQTGEMVARYLAYVGPEAAALLLYLLGTFYNNALMAIELTGNLGLWAQTVLRDKYKYQNFYKWKGRDDRTPGYRKIQSIGWETTARTREVMLSSFRGALHGQRAFPRDAALLQQMEAAELVGDRWEVPEKIHDDLLISAMVGWIAKEQWHVASITGSKQLLGDEVKVDVSEENKKEMPQAKGDVEAAVAAHWSKMMGIIKRGGPPMDRLAGV